VFWRDRTAGGETLRAANTNAAGLMSQATVTSTRVLAIAPRKYLALGQASGVLESRSIAFADAGSAAVSAPVSTGMSISSTAPIVSDTDGKLYAIVYGMSAPFPTVPLAGNVDLTLVTPRPQPYSVLNGETYADFNTSAPRALWGAIGRETANSQRGMFVHELRLDTGELLPGARMSTAEVVVEGNSIDTCIADPRVQSPGPGVFVASWRQRNSGAYGCDLLVNGQKLNTGAWGPYKYELAATASGGAVAVWDEEDPVTRFWSRIRYTTKASTSANWAAPSALPGEPLGESASIEIVARGPGGTLALVWTPLQNCSTTSCKIYEYRVSKYVNGVWTTQSLALGTSLRKIAINASGSGVLTSEETDCNANGSCTRGLSLYRF